MPIRKKVVSNSFVLTVKSKDGISVSVLSTEVKYATSSSFVNPSSIAESSWSTSYPSSVSEGTWIHSRTKVNYSDGHKTVTYHSSRIGANGQGTAGYNTAPVFLYKRSATAITSVGFSNTLTYTFAKGKLNSTPNGWSQSIPADDGNPLYVTVATAYSNTATDTIASSEWATPVLFVQNGGQGAHGINTAPVFLYKRAASAPDKPTSELTYTFATGVLSGTLSGWSQTIPDTDGNPCWVIQATAVGTGATDSIAASEWSEQHKLVEDGAAGKDAIYATITRNVGVVPCNSSGNTTSEQTVETYVAIEKGGVGQTITGIACKINDSYELGTSYASEGTPSPTINFKKTTTLNSGYVKITIKSGTSLSSTVRIVITVSATIDGVSTSRKVTLTIEGQIPGGKGDPGDPGSPGSSVYGLSLSPTCVKLKKDFANVVSAVPSNFTLSLQYKGANASLPSGYNIYYRADGSGSWTSASLGSKNTLSFFDNGSRGSLEFVMSTESSSSNVADGNIVARASVAAVWEINRMLVPAGEYEEKEYTRNGAITPLVHKKVSGTTSEYWFLDADTNKYYDSVSSIYKFAAPADNSEYWKQASYFEVVLTKMLFAEFAKLSSFIVYGDYFFSQYGTLVVAKSEIAIGASKITTNYNGITPIVLNGENEDDGIIVCKVNFYASANSQIKITLSPSSEANYDFGVIGVLGTVNSPGNAKWLESATATTIKNTVEGTYFLQKSSGKSAKETTITISTSGTYFIEIAYAKDSSSEGYDDKAEFVFKKLSGTVSWRSIERVSENNGMTYKGYCMSSVPYGWFDPDDPMAEKAPATGYKFRPTKCINALTGEEWGTNAHLSGEVHATGGEFTGTVRALNFFHGVCIGYSEEWYYLNHKPTITLNGDGDIDCSTQSEYDAEVAFWRDYEEGKYYQWTDERKASIYGDPLSNIENPPYTLVFVPCTGPADIVVIPNTANDTGDITVILPLASDYDGKIVEIVDTRYTQPSSSYYVGNLLVKQADSANKMKGTFTGNNMSSLTMNGNYDHDGKSYRLLSYNGYWVKLGTS